MLVLTRKEDQSIMIGDTIEVKLLDIKEHQVKIGIIAPKDVAVHRREVYLSIQAENTEAASSQDTSGVEKLISGRGA